MCSLYCIVLLNAILYTPVHYRHDKSNDQIDTLPKINLLKPCKIAQSAMFRKPYLYKEYEYCPYIFSVSH